MHRMIAKYTPKKLSEFEGREVALLQLKEFVNKYRKGSLLFYGAPGSGKTVAVYALAKEMNYEVLELSASDTRNKEKLLETIGNASQQMSLFNKGKIILVDDVDNLSSKDRGAAKIILDIIKDSKWPVILTANDPEKEKIKDLKKKSTMIEFPSLTYLEIFKVLKNICDNEKIEYDENTLKSLARQSGGDMRAAMTDLQVLYILSDKIDNLDV
ncbi:MAG: AAA family ATPase, partial [Nanoarchaeota archaeon]|nr:AAA family ATPase [Nanoarchaeota archaeon]